MVQIPGTTTPGDSGRFRLGQIAWDRTLGELPWLSSDALNWGRAMTPISFHYRGHRYGVSAWSEAALSGG